MKRAWGLIIGLVLLAGVALPAHAEKWKEVNAQELKAMMKAAGFGHVDVHNLSAGVVALHVGIKC